MTTYIPDGYQLEGYVAEQAMPEGAVGFVPAWVALEFTYRPAARLEVIQHDADVKFALKKEDEDPKCAVKAELLACEFVAKRVVSWDLKAAGVHDVPVSTDSVSRIHGALFGRMYRIIRGSESSDIKPGESAPATTAEGLEKN